MIKGVVSDETLHDYADTAACLGEGRNMAVSTVDVIKMVKEIRSLRKPSIKKPQVDAALIALINRIEKIRSKL